MSGWRFCEGNPEYDRYIHSAAWRKRADARLELDGHTCCVCGRKATEVHHLTYERFRQETMEDLVSLCGRCHRKAEELYDPTVIPWEMDEIKPGGNNFMAAMRADAAAGIRPIAGVECLAEEDYRQLNALADHMVEVSGTGTFRGEYRKDETENA